MKAKEARETSLRERISKLQPGDAIKLTPTELGFGGVNCKEADIVEKKAWELGLRDGSGRLCGSDRIPPGDEPIQFVKR